MGKILVVIDAGHYGDKYNEGVIANLDLNQR